MVVHGLRSGAHHANRTGRLDRRPEAQGSNDCLGRSGRCETQRGFACYFGPPVAKASDGKLWFHTGEGIQLVDPHHVAFNKLPPPVHIEQIIADNKVYWQNLPGAAVSNLRLPARTRDLQIDYTALSLVAPEKVHFKYKLEGQDQRLERGGQRPPSAVLEPCSPAITAFA